MMIPAGGPKKLAMFAPLGSAVLLVMGVAALGTAIKQPAVLWNQTASEPVGLYVRSTAAPRPGVIVAFRAPAEAFPYADRRMGYLRRVPILKAIAAAEDDRVCTDGGVLKINGIRRGLVLDHDSHGDRLPAWRGCRELKRGEVFVFSDRIANSFDSRYYGPIDRGSILGVFEPFVVTSDRARRA
jgi:conjugative transfer signal peptidase TraF